MRAARLKKRLIEARRTWLRENRNQDIAGLPGYIDGVLKGFNEALRILRDVQREEVHKTITVRRMLSRFRAIELYQACRQAYGRLRQSDRAGAMRALQQSLEKIPPVPKKDVGPSGRKN